MQRILVIGSSGAGKSTLSRRLSQWFDLPRIHLDREHFWTIWFGPERSAGREHACKRTRSRDLRMWKRPSPSRKVFILRSWPDIPALEQQLAPGREAT
jgi:hypothetical protein